MTSQPLAIFGAGALFLDTAAMDSPLCGNLTIVFGIGSTGYPLIVIVDCIKNARRTDAATDD